MTRLRIKGLFIGLMAAMSTVALAATFDYFSPATGILVGTSSTYVTTAATSSNVRALWTGTCNASSYLRGDGACAAPVTSVALTMPSGFSVGGSPVTTTGTLAVTTTLNGVIHGDGSGFTASNVNLASEVTGTLPVANGGTGITSGTSGGIPYFSGATTVASSAALAANQLVLGGGAGTTPATLGSLGTTTTVLHGNAAGAPTFGAVANADLTNSTITINGTAVALGASRTLTLASADFANQGTTTTVLHGNAAGNPSFGAVSLTTDVSGTLPVANGGTNLTAATDDDTMVGNGTTWQSKAIPDCDDTSGNHLNYDTTTNTFSCGTTATTKFARGYFECEDTTCATITSAGVSSITRNGIGNYTVNLNAGFTTAPVCVATSTFFTDFTTAAWMGATTTTAATVSIGSIGTAMTTADGDFHIICQGV